MKNQWEVWTGALSSDYCDYIIQRAQRHFPQNATIGFKDSNRADLAYRTSTLRWLDVDGGDRDIAEVLMAFAKKSNRSNFGFDLTSMNEIQFTEYYGSKRGHYDWHHDVHWENEAPYDRKLSIVVQLSNPYEYEGGAFEFNGCASPASEQWSPRGSVLIFPSFFLHRVTEVTKGERRSLVSWVEGPKWC